MMASQVTMKAESPPMEVTLALKAMERLPLPVAVVARVGGRLSFLATNTAYRAAGLGTIEDPHALIRWLAPRINTFFDSDAETLQFPWEVGDPIDSRHYDVAVQRSAFSPEDRCLITLIDRTSQQRSERSLRREMTTDSLTGLPNREGFGDLIETVREERGRHAILVVDLARFGRLNGCLGSMSGDELLITVARRIKGALRARDSLGRIGGDEFGILMRIDADEKEATHLAKRIRKALATPFRLSDYEIRIECSIGMAFGDADVDGEELIRHAQFATKRAKASGKAECYQTQAFAIAREQFAIETALRRAIEQDQLHLAFQPLCDLSTGRIIAFEALSRWRTEDGRDISPVDFIPVAEESGLIVPLGRWALETATRTLAEWDRKAGGDCGVQMAVNLSPIQLQRDNVVGMVADALAKAGLAGHRLKLELTESALVADPDRTAGIMRALKDLGTTLAMDDFGTGYSNLAFLQKLPIDILKIDRSFVTGMLADRDKIAIVRAILGLAQALSLRTVAEGIETDALAQTLAALGCCYGQGYLYARPLPADAAYAMIA